MVGKTKLVQAATKKIRFHFENRVVFGQFNDEVISQFHPVVQFIGEWYRTKGIRPYFPVLGVKVSSYEVPNLLKGEYVFIVQRWSITVGLRDIERLAYQVFSLNTKRFVGSEAAELLVNTTVHKGNDWLSAGNELDGDLMEDVYVQCEDSLDERYKYFVESMLRENEDRIAFQLSNLEQYFNKKEREWGDKVTEMYAQGKNRGAPLLKSKLEKERKRTEEKKSAIEKSMVPKHTFVPVCSGVIRIY